MKLKDRKWKIRHSGNICVVSSQLLKMTAFPCLDIHVTTLGPDSINKRHLSNTGVKEGTEKEALHVFIFISYRGDYKEQRPIWHSSAIRARDAPLLLYGNCAILISLITLYDTALH